MLVLSRKKSQQIKIGPNVWLTVVEVRGDRVKLAFDAPREVVIHREEVQRLIEKQNEE